MRSWHAKAFGHRRRVLALVVAAVGGSLVLAPSAGARLTSSGGGPRGTVWVTNQTLNTVAAYDARTGRLLGTVAVGAKPIGIVAPPGTGKVYVSNESDDRYATGSGRGETGAEWTIEVVVRPYGAKRSRIGSSSSISRR